MLHPLRLHPVIDFLPVYGDFLRRIHANPHLMALDIEHGHGDFMPDLQTLANSSRQYPEHSPAGS